MQETEYIKDAIQDAYELGEQMAQAYDNGYLQSLAKTNTKVVQAFKTRYEAIGYQLKYGLITEEEYYDKLAQIRDMYFSRNSQEWHKYTAEIYDYKVGVLEDYKQAVEENLNNILKISQEKFGQILKEQQSYSEKLSESAGGIGLKSHQVYIGNYYPNGDPLIFTEHTLTEFDEEIKKLERFAQSVEMLKDRAEEISPETLQSFFSELRDIPADDAQVLMDLLLKSNEADFNKYFESYQKRNDLADVVSASLYELDAQSVANQLRDELGAAFAEIPEEFYTYGELNGESFVEGFMSQLQDFSGDLEAFFAQGQIDISQIGENGDNVNQSVFSPVYYFYGDRGTTSRTRMTAKNDALFIYLRGME